MLGLITCSFTVLCIIILLGTTSQISSFYGMGAGIIALGLVACTGTERRLIDCPSGSLYRCTHSRDAGVRCMLQTGNEELIIRTYIEHSNCCVDLSNLIGQ